jgi:hypothetical protein
MILAEISAGGEIRRAELGTFGKKSNSIVSPMLALMLLGLKM